MRVRWGYESPWGPDGSPSLPISFLTSTHVVIFHRMSGGSNWKSLDESIFTAAAKWIVISHQTLSPATVQGLLFHQIWIAQINSAHHQHTKQIHKIISLQVATRTNYKIAQSKWQRQHCWTYQQWQLLTKRGLTVKKSMRKCFLIFFWTASFTCSLT